MNRALEERPATCLPGARRVSPAALAGGPLARIAVPPVLAAAAVVALAVPRLGRRAVWLDEAFTVGATHDLAATWRGSGGTMALYYLLMWPVTQVTTERVGVRLPSLVCAAAAVVVVHEVGRLVGGRRVAAFTAGTLALTWALSRFAIEARSYALALLLVSLSWLGLVGAVRAAGAEDGADEAARRRWWRLFVVAALLAPLAHGMAALHFAAQLGALALAPDRRRWLRACVPVGAALAVEGALLFGLGAGEVASWVDPLHWGQVASFGRMLFGRGPALWVVGGLSLVAAAMAVARYRRDDTEAWLRVVPVFWAAGAPLLILAFSLARPYAESRYVIGAVPGVALLVGGALARIRPPAAAVVAWVVVALALLPGQGVVTSGGGEDWPGLADRVAAEARDGDRLLAPAMLRAPFDYAWGEGSGRPDLAPLSPVEPIGPVRRFYDVAPGGLRAQLLEGPTGTTWYVDRDEDRLDDVERLLADPGVAARYEASGRWTFRGPLYLVRFDPRTPG